MAKGGTFSVARTIWNHPVFRDQPKTEREAWIWMLSEASWRDRSVRAGDHVVALRRGQLVGSLRFCAKSWDWHDSKVRRFLARLQKHALIEVATDAGVSIITICKYDIYQGEITPVERTATRQRRSSEAKENKDERKRKEGEKESCLALVPFQPPSSADDISHAMARYNDFAEEAGWPLVQKLNQSRSKQIGARLSDCGGMEGWEVALRKAFDSDFCRGRTEKPWHGFSFDWLIKAANFTKLMEGNYDNRSRKAPQGPSTYTDADIFHAAARNRNS